MNNNNMNNTFENNMNNTFENNIDNVGEKLQILNNNYDKLLCAKNNLLNSEKKLDITNLLNNIIILNNDLECIIDHIDKININIENNILTDCSEETIKLIINREHTKKILKPFLPYLLLYNMLT